MSAEVPLRTAQMRPGAAASYVPILSGDRLTLRPMVEADLPLLSRWFSDEEFQRHQWGAWTAPMSLEGAREFWTRFQAADPAAPDCALFAIDHDRRPVGFANYRRLDRKHANADIGIGLGEKALWGQGLGTAALRLLVHHLLEGRGLHRIRLHVAATNDRAIASYKKAGFELEGIERDGVRGADGAFRDMAVMGLVAGRDRAPFDPVPTVLEGTHVRLEPLRMEHVEELFPALDDDDAWAYAGWRPRSPADVARYVRNALDQQVLGHHLPWLTRRLADGVAIGTTRYGAIDRTDRSVEIGWTVLGAGARRTAANTEAKYLQLRHAFEVLGAVRVWLKADVLNERSRRAIARLGATEEGIIRSERILPDGRIRDATYYSILEREWPAVSRRLRGYLVR